MPGFSSYDDLIQEVTANSKTFRNDWNKLSPPTTPAVAGEWFCYARGGGNPPADALYNTGTNLTWQPTYDTTANANGLRHGGNVAPDYKYILNASIGTSAATTMPAMAMLVDLVGFYRFTSVTTTPGSPQSTTNTITSVTNTVTAVDDANDTLDHTFYALLTGTRVQMTTSGSLPTGLSLATNYYVIKVSDTRMKLASSYANAIAGTAINLTSTGSGTHTINTLLPRYTNGEGVQAFIWNNNSTALGSATPNITLGYTNSAQTASRATPATLPIGKTAAANGLIVYSGNGSGKYGPFMPLQADDRGIAEVNAITLSVSYVSGEMSIALARPLITLPMTTLGVFSERDFLNQVPSLPRVYDGANLVWLMYNGANTPANSGFFGQLTFGWG